MRPQQSLVSPSTPPPGPNSGAPPHIGNPMSGSALPSAASAFVFSEPEDSEQPSVTLDEWWLARVEGQERKIAVAGFFERNNEVLRLVDALIAKRYDPNTLETEDGTTVFLYGFFNTERSLKNGYTVEVCETFSLGFPPWWENWNSNVPSAFYVECNNDDGSKAGRDGEGHQKRCGYLKKPGKATAMQSSDKGNQSPLTRGCAKFSSMSTPESLKLKKTKSGRVVVPSLDPGRQSIVYDHDGSISAIIGLDSPPSLKGSTSKNYSSKKR